MAVNAPVCRHCNYLVAGLPTLICPECGSDLRQVGIRVPGEPRAYGIAGPLLACTMMVFVPLVMLSILLSGTVQRLTSTSSVGFAPWFQQQANPVQSLYVTCTGSGICWTWGSAPPPAPVQTVTFQVNISGHLASSLQCDIHGNFQPANSSPRPLDAPSVLAWLAKSGLDPATTQARQLADDIVAALPEIRAGGLQTVGFTDLGPENNSGNRHIGGSVLRPLWLLGALIWTILAWPIWRRRHHPIRGMPTCGHVGCSCDARRFTDFICPQCGSDTRRCGIRVPLRHPWSGLAAPIVSYGLLTLFAGAVTGTILDNMFWQFSSSCTETFLANSDSADPLIQQVGIATAAHGIRYSKEQPINYTNDPPDQITLTLQIKGHRPLIASLERNGSCHYLNTEGETIARSWTLPAVLQMLRTAGLDPADKVTQQLATDLPTAVAQSWAGKLDQVHFSGLDGGGRGSSSSSGDPDWLFHCQWLVWLLLWPALLWRLLRHQKTRRRNFQPADRIAPAANVDSSVLEGPH